MELFVVGMMTQSPQTAIFYYILAYEVFSGNQKEYIPDLYAMGFFLPGPYLKNFFLIIQGHSSLMLILSYIALYTPSLLLLCVFSYFEEQFRTVVWKRINATLQWVSDGLILVTIYRMMRQ
jgi:chromate transport protein ChrA